MALLSETVTVRWHGRNKTHYTAIGYKFTKMGDEFEIPVEHLPKGSIVMIKISCDYCGEERGTTWQKFLNGRKKISKDSCSDMTCRSMKKAEIRDGFYRTIADDMKLLREYSAENELPADRVLANSDEKVTWVCEEDHEWQATVNNRTRGKGCPICARKYKEPLSITHPKLADEWADDVRSPEDITAGSNYRAKWKCSSCSHEWHAMIFSRTSLRTNCPTCARKYKEPLSTTHPELAREWADDERSPEDITAGSHYRAEWKCMTCSYEWSATVSNRTNSKTGCPACNESKGEKLAASILDSMDVDFSREVEFPNGKLIGEGNGFLRYDFGILLNGQLIALIEYDGGQHFKPIEHFGGQEGYDRLVRHDTLKDEFAELNDLSLLRIRYDLPESEIKRQVTDFVESCLSFEKLIQSLV